MQHCRYTGNLKKLWPIKEVGEGDRMSLCILVSQGPYFRAPIVPDKGRILVEPDCYLCSFNTKEAPAR
jgi:hypothetical protein